MYVHRYLHIYSNIYIIAVIQPCFHWCTSVLLIWWITMGFHVLYLHQPIGLISHKETDMFCTKVFTIKWWPLPKGAKGACNNKKKRKKKPNFVISACVACQFLLYNFLSVPLSLPVFLFIFSCFLSMWILQALMSWTNTENMNRRETRTWMERWW